MTWFCSTYRVILEGLLSQCIYDSSSAEEGGLFMRVVSTGKIVIYTGEDGNPNTEYRAPDNGQQTYLISVSEITGGGTILATWWAPYDNIGDLTSFAQILVAPSGTQVALTVGAYNTQGHRMRIVLYVMVD
jgi:hypothetical protein